MALLGQVQKLNAILVGLNLQLDYQAHASSLQG